MSHVRLSGALRSIEVSWGHASAPQQRDTSGGTDVFGPFIAAQLEGEEQRQRSFEGRGVTVVTSSGTLATLLTGFITIASGGNTFQLPDGATWTLAAALGFFVLAAVGGLYVNVPVDVSRPTSAWLGTLKDDGWNDRREDAAKTVAASQLLTLASTLKNNRRKGFVLSLAIGSELCAVAALAATTTWVAVAL